MKVDFYKHNVDNIDIEEVNKVLKTPFLSTGQRVKDFEEALSKYLQIPYTLGVTSCTSALHLALLISGVKEGDEVITCPMTFISTSNSVLYCNATPVFVDSDKYTGCINTTALNKKITRKTKVILPIHYCGQLCDMKKIDEIAITNGVKIVEDCAHALETAGAGFFGISCYSFYPIKAITSGEGGALALWNAEDKALGEILRLNGMDKDAWKRYESKKGSDIYKHWDMPVLGYKCNMYNIQAALLIGQLSRIEELHKKRVKVFDKYYKVFSKIEEIQLPKLERSHSKLMFTFWVNPKIRDKVLVELQNKEIGVGVHYTPVHLTTYYRKRFGYKPGDFPNAELIGRSTISIPCYSSLTEDQQDYVIRKVEEAVLGRS